MPKHYRPSGKKIEGTAARYITRTKALRHLQISLQDFRRLCILKGIFPREPKKKFEGNLKTYYHAKDIAFLAHEPLLDKFRDIRSYGHRIVKAHGKKNKSLAQQLTDRKPSYKLVRLILEKYPTFSDALEELQDCLTMVHLFAALPATEAEHIRVTRIHNCQRLCAEWQAYISGTASLQKAYLAVKGIYYEGKTNRNALTPYPLQQVVTDDVDYNIMLTFLEFYESMDLKYPPVPGPRKEALEELYTIFRVFKDKLEPLSLEPQVVDPSQLVVSTSKPGMLVDLVERSAVDSEKTRTRSPNSLFRNMKFFLSREAATESILFVIQAFGGTVSWEGDGAPFKETEEGITHQIFDRPTVDHVYLSRDYVQPQWVYDCVNKRMILPTDEYKIGRVPPPHLSPFDDDKEKDYFPEHATIKHLQDGDPNKHNIEALNISAHEYFDELNTEILKRCPQLVSVPEKNVEGSEVKEALFVDPEQEAKDGSSLSEIMMPRKRRKLYQAMQICNERNKAHIKLREERKKKASKSE